MCARAFSLHGIGTFHKQMYNPDILESWRGVVVREERSLPYVSTRSIAT